MGSYAVTSGTIHLRDVPEARAIQDVLESLAIGREEVRIEQQDPESGTFNLSIFIAGYSNALGAAEIDETICAFGPYAVEGARFTMEWEGERGCFYVGSPEQIAQAESRDAAQAILSHIPKLQNEDTFQVLQELRGIRSPWKRRYLSTGGECCPFCGTGNLTSREPEMQVDRILVWITCPSCGRRWYAVYELVDANTAMDKDCRSIPDDAACLEENPHV